MQTLKKREGDIQRIQPNPKEGFIMKPFVLLTQWSCQFSRSRSIGALVVSVALLFAFLLIPASPAAAVPTMPDEQQGQTSHYSIRGPSALADRTVPQDIGVADINNFWIQLFAAAKLPYYPPNIVAFDQTGGDGVNTQGCGYQPPQTGPFYCVADHTIYWDLYIAQLIYLVNGDEILPVVAALAHEWGHHIQILLYQLGLISQQLLRYVTSEHIELQADCFAGAYVKYAYNEGELPGIMGSIEIEATATTFGILGELGVNHGDFNQRYDAFVVGFQKGVGGCGWATINTIVVYVQGLSLKPTQPVSLSVKALGRAGLEISAQGLNAESVELQVFDTAGQLVFSQESHSGVLRYRGLNSAGRPLANGVYLYVITVHTAHGEVLHKVQKVAILR
jgi:predicted metalloprotease